MVNMDLRDIQRLRRLTIFAGLLISVALLLFTQSTWHPGARYHEGLEVVGIAMIIVCIVGRTWTSLYIGGRKRNEIVATGPYSLVRNPLYIFSVIGGTGIGLVTGSILIALAIGAAALIIFHFVVLREEKFLLDNFGPAYADYILRVPRWWPGFSHWRDEQSILVRPATVVITFREACLFLMAVPIFEFIEYWQQLGVFPILLRLP